MEAGADVVEELRERSRRVRVLEALRGLVVLALQIVDLRLIERGLAPSSAHRRLRECARDAEIGAPDRDADREQYA